ncbi:hypothetical protein NQ315_010702 [Exocentrus adspersus]|uniref:Uncharacterized protein n=1 Tax=Exocentrus adspersus TaxID=1586481 RepID=A0AAV8VV81_9CUCU|nr:hypothetical protein NQ315_010702 [Exocentrus adspersus]
MERGRVARMKGKECQWTTLTSIAVIPVFARSPGGWISEDIRNGLNCLSTLIF